MYRVAFANPHVSGLFWWNLDDNGIPSFQKRKALGENLPSAGLIRNGVPKESYGVLDRLINEEWHTDVTLTTDSEGRTYFRGFYGDYNVSVNNLSEERRFYKENTGYYHVTAGPMEQKILLSK